MLLPCRKRHVNQSYGSRVRLSITVSEMKHTGEIDWRLLEQLVGETSQPMLLSGLYPSHCKETKLFRHSKKRAKIRRYKGVPIHISFQSRLWNAPSTWWNVNLFSQYCVWWCSLFLCSLAKFAFVGHRPHSQIPVVVAVSHALSASTMSFNSLFLKRCIFIIIYCKIVRSNL